MTTASLGTSHTEPCGWLEDLCDCEPQARYHTVPILSIIIHHLPQCFLEPLDQPLWGWHAKARNWVTFSHFQSLLDTWDMNRVPWSVRISLQMPSRLKTWGSSLANVLAEMLQRVIREVAESIIAALCLCPLIVFNKEVTKPIVILSKRALIMRSGSSCGSLVGGRRIVLSYLVTNLRQI